MKDIELIRLLLKTILASYTSYKQIVLGKFKQHKIDLTYEMFQILYCLWNQEGVNQQDLANQTVKDKASLTLLINNLEKRNLVERKGCELDGRNKKVFLTAKGKDLEKTVMPLVSEIYKSIIKQIDEKEAVASLTFLQNLNAILKNEC